MARVIPIFRIFDYEKALAFYVSWLGFRVDWEDKREDSPIYLQISLGDIVLHLSEHHGDSTPGARAYIAGFTGLQEFHHNLSAKPYKFSRPGLEQPPWNPGTWSMEVIDPFGNRLTFNEA